jgi:hypothetical protein
MIALARKPSIFSARLALWDFLLVVLEIIQKSHNERFADASHYARREQTHPVYVGLAAASLMSNAYNFALSDWFHPPEIQRIERLEGSILVEATDNIMVARVRVTVLDQEGKVLEAGEAVRGEGDFWEYAPQAQGTTIQAEAWDLPGHKVTYRCG